MLHRKGEDQSENEDLRYLSLGGYYLLAEMFHIDSKISRHQPSKFIPPIKKLKTVTFRHRCGLDLL